MPPRTGPVRPAYGEFAWAYDLLVDEPVRRECGTIAAWLVERGVLPGAAVLDAGCGTGRYAIELSRRGYRADGIDLSTVFILQAREAAAELVRPVSFLVGDIRALPARAYDGILCRNMLGELAGTPRRGAIFARFRRALRSEGVLIADVCEWDATAERKRHEPLFRKSVVTRHGKLTLTRVTELEPETRRLVVTDRHTLEGTRHLYEEQGRFLVQCWTQSELDSALRKAGFRMIQHFGAYKRSVPAGATDRLVVVAQT